jgi:hypothetical protein
MSKDKDQKRQDKKRKHDLDRLRKHKNQIVAQLKAIGTTTQVGIMSQALDSGALSPDKLHKELSNKAADEMSKGYDRIAKKGDTPTVDLLLAEYREELAFKALADRVGLNEQWFINLAEGEIQRRNGSAQ